MPATEQERGRIVVGVDGSSTSKDALRWALRQARVTGATVEAVTAWEYPQFYGSMGWSPPETDPELERAARKVLADAIAEVASEEPGVEVRPVVAYGVPAAILLEAAKDAALLVVGNRGHGGFTGALLGSVGQHCVQHASCPVVIIRERTAN
ncbi:universal stress protein [Streptomyces sp. ICBB 8177]|uniref:universal stress protein n=1 Tax=Streptomyces sp. ICBB 8177 TaxID=563922 RepID=UPI000D676D8E|nr:universal stress protein [Streptomyces sp. ICBB 8177]PWI44735.1 universal stress protein UspA [Streptomyces sp. ICBB 8177]